MDQDNIKAPEIKIDCFTISMKKYKTNKDEDSFYGFDEFYKERKITINSEGQEEEEIENKAFLEFFKSYVSSFDNKFAVQNKTGKAIFLNTVQLKFNSKLRTICGIIEGGTTNMGGAIKEQDNTNDDDSFTLTPNHVETQPYYFLFWFPEHSKTGLLLFQSYSSKSVCDVFKRHLQRFIANSASKASLIFGATVPKELVNEIKKRGVVDKVILRKYKLDGDKASRIFGLDYKITDELTVELKITGISKVAVLREQVARVISGDNTKFFDVKELENIGLDESSETIFEYDHNGRKASVRSADQFKLTPSFYIEEKDIERHYNLLPKFESLDTYCRSFLNKLIEDIT